MNQICSEDNTEPQKIESHVLSNFYSPCNTYLNMHIDGPVTDDSLNLIIDNIVLANTFVNTVGETGFENLEYINIFVSSEGGDLPACFRLLTAIDCSKIPIRTIGWGECASAGLMILMAGHERLVSPNTMLMSHYASYITSGGSMVHTMDRSQVNMTNIMAELMHNAYVRYTKKPLSYIKKHLIKANRDDVYVMPETAIKHGVVDRIFTSFDELTKPPARK